MYKAKAWLHSQGHIATAGRGRPPKVSAKDGREITAILLEAKQSGVQFSDWPKGEVTVTKTVDNKTQVSVKREPTPNNNKVVEPAPYTYPESEFEAYEFIDGKKSPVGMRECCNTCRVSFVGHICETPTYLDNRTVFIVRKKATK